ncbi:MAG: 50S ribosomal protein L6 [Pseudomonadota bacterium]
MSRVGKKPILLPKGVKVELKERHIKVTGPKGTMERTFPSKIIIKQENETLLLDRADEETSSKALHGLTRSLIGNMVIGVSEGFREDMEIVGVGYKAQMRGKDVLNMSLGYSHPIDFFIPKGITIAVEAGKGSTKLKIEGCDKQLVGEVAAQLRRLRAPEPYKGKGLKYASEIIKKKVGKAIVGAGAK